ncbi:hypothetical protein HMPREF1508_1239 [Shuttleworthella sp. MSX8B]|nr:hypothetical protein HMPREF1508_1239 [Shuttleworthia sp. MSX8B]
MCEHPSGFLIWGGGIAVATMSASTSFLQAIPPACSEDLHGRWCLRRDR